MSGEGLKNIPCKKSGKKEIMKTKKIEMMQRMIHSKTGTRL
jgi:hypothetical protein